MPFTAFGMHVEDSNMGSINIHHEGAPRTWYGVGSSNASALEELVQKNSTEFDCDLFIRHKASLIPPKLMTANGIQYGKVLKESD